MTRVREPNQAFDPHAHEHELELKGGVCNVPHDGADLDDDADQHEQGRLGLEWKERKGVSTACATQAQKLRSSYVDGHEEGHAQCAEVDDGGD